jgi:hypothetical protein
MYAGIAVVPVEIALPVVIRCTVALEKYRKFGIRDLQSIHLKGLERHSVFWALVVTANVASHCERACGNTDQVLCRGGCACPDQK